MNGLRRLIVCTLVGLIVSAPASFAHDETPVVTVSSASFERDVPLAPDAIASGFGEELATVTESAATVPLPTELAGTTVVLTDSTGVERPAQLVFVSVKQVNYLIPAGMATGLAAVRITSGDGDISTGVVDIASVSPGLFTANATGGGVAAGSVLRVAEDGIRQGLRDWTRARRRTARRGIADRPQACREHFHEFTFDRRPGWSTRQGAGWGSQQAGARISAAA